MQADTALMPSTKPSLKNTMFIGCFGLLLTIICVWTVDPAMTVWLMQHPPAGKLLLSANLLCVVFNPTLWGGIMTIMLIMIGIRAYGNHIKTDRQKAIAAWCVGFFCLEIIGIILKIAIGRARPLLDVQDHIVGFFPFTGQYNYYSMPSGHVLCATVLFCGLCLLTRTVFWRIIGLGVLLLVMAARVILFKHFIGDTLLSITLVLTLLPYRHGLALWAINGIERMRYRADNPGAR